MRMRFVIIWGLLFALASAPALAAGGEDEAGSGLVLETVVVKADKRSGEAQKVPTSMTVFNAADIHDMDIKGVRDLAEVAPNMAFHDFGSRRHALLFMRGIKSLPGGQAGTGFTVDGLNYSKAYMFMGLPLFDVERIEVLRGAQGTLYGRNTTGGVINLYTAEPGDEFLSSASATYGSYGKRELRANASGPLVEDKLYLGLYGLVGGEDSYVENDVATGGDEGRHKKGLAGRMKLRFQGAEDWKTTLSVDGQHHDDGSFPLRRTARNGYVKAGALSPDSRYHYSHDYEGSEKIGTWNVNLNTELKTGIGTLQSITGYQDYNTVEWIDADMSPFDAMRKRVNMDDGDLSQEFRLTSPEGGGPFRWLMGTYLFHFDGGNYILNKYGTAHALNGQSDRFDTDLKNTGAALFGEATYTFASRLDLTVGLRGEYEHTEGRSLWTRTNGGAVTQRGFFDESEDYTGLLPKLSLAWRFDDDVMAYGAVSKSHKVGGFNSAWVPSGSESYGEEESWLYEVGVKSFLADRRLMLDVAGFYTTIKDEQLTQFMLGTTQGYLDNAGKSHRVGVELESRYKLTEAWTLSANGAWIEARFDEYEDAANGIDYAGKQVFCVPEYTYNLAVDYRDRVAEDWVLFGRLDVSGVGPQHFDDANTVRQGAYELVNMRLGFQWRDLECSLWSRNLFDRHYVAFENTTAGFAEDGRPATFGATVAYTF